MTVTQQEHLKSVILVALRNLGLVETWKVIGQAIRQYLKETEQA